MRRLPWMLLPYLVLLCAVEAYKALVIVPLPMKSHSILGDSLVELLADAGNEVTYLTSFPREKVPARVKEIAILQESDKKLWSDNLNLTEVLERKLSYVNVTGFISTLNELNLKTLVNNDVQTLINDPNEKFDVIIAEWLHSDIYAGLTPIFDCPLIWLSTVEHHWRILRLIDEIPNPTYTIDITSSNQPPFNFLQRVQELASQLSGLMVEYFYTSKLYSTQYKNIIAPSIRKRGKLVPNFEELRFNASLVLGNSHVSLGSAKSLPPSYKPIAGYHISKKEKPLPKDLKSILDNSEHGVIYFSLGSNLKSGSLPDDLKSGILKILGGLKQIVLWKFEADIPDKPSNVHIMQWAPQESILAHQNCILFITHGGLLSMIEAMHFGKPLIGIPIYGDQFKNVATAVRKGYAKEVQFSYTMADKLRVAIEEIIRDPSYANRAKELSFVYFHRPVSPAVEAVHWVDHVVKTRGASHSRSPALLVRWYQKTYLDLVLLILGIVFGMKFLITRLCCMMFAKGKSKKMKKN